MKKKLQVSFSGGETSAYMTMWCLENLKDEYEMIVVFANTGDEREETLEFVDKCDKYLGFDTVWVEAEVHHDEKKSNTHRIVTFDTASRNAEPFKETVKKYGIPNQSYPHCTRALKLEPMTSYTRMIFGADYYTAIGIRADEFDRMNENYVKLKYIYPLIDNGITKRHINAFWENQPFRLELKGYEGNCQACWKKSDRKLFTLALEQPEVFENMMEIENEFYGKHPFKPAFYFYRKNRSAEQIIQQANNTTFKPATDDSEDSNYQMGLFDPELDVGFGCSESCEPF